MNGKTETAFELSGGASGRSSQLPVRTGSWLLRPLAPSLSSNAVSVFPFMSTAALPRGGRRALRARRTTGQVYMDPSAESRRGGSPAGAGGTLARNDVARCRALLHDLDEIPRLRVGPGVERVHEAQLLLLGLFDRDVLRVVLDLRLLVLLDDLVPVGLRVRV